MADSTDVKARQGEVLALLLAADSPARKLEEFKGLFKQLEELEKQQQDATVREELFLSVLPAIEEAEQAVRDAENQVAQEKAKLADFAGELGKTAFEALRSGDIADGPHFTDRKAVQARINELQQQKLVVSASESTGMLDKAKTQAQILKITGQLKLEEFKIASANKALGSALLASRNLAPVRCETTEPLLKEIVTQNKKVNASIRNLEEQTSRSAKRIQDAAQQIRYSGKLTGEALRTEIATARKQMTACKRACATLHYELLTKAIACEPLVAKIPALVDLEISRDAIALAGDHIKQIGDHLSQHARKHLSTKMLRYAAVGGSILLVLVLLSTFWSAGSSEDSESMLAFERDSQAGGANNDSVSELSEVGELLDNLVAIKKLGGEVKRANLFPDSPIMITMDKDTSDADLQLMKDMTGELGYLQLGNCSKVTDAGLKHLQNLRGLRALYLGGTKLTDAGMAYLKGLTQLEVLGLTSTDISNRGLSHLEGMTTLRMLDLRGTLVTNEGMKSLQRLTDLKYLDLRGSTVTYDGLDCLSGLTKLQQLGVGKSRDELRKGNGLQSFLASSPTGSRSESPLWPKTFKYTVRGKGYQGRCEVDDTQVLSRGKAIVIYPDEAINTSHAVRVVPVDLSESVVSTAILGFEGNDFVARPGLGGMWLNIMFIVKKPKGEFEEFKNQMLLAPATGATVSATCLDPNNGYRGPFFFGKRASTVPKRDQRLVFVDTGVTFGGIDLGEPTKVANQGAKDVLSYWELSPGNLYFFCNQISKPGKPLVLEAGGKRWSIDESALHTLRLLASAVAHLRYSVGYTKESDAILGD